MPNRQQRYTYQPITRHTSGHWPNGVNLAVYFVMGVEEYDFLEGQTEDLMPGMPRPDYANTSWRDYGNRVGALRLQRRFADYDVPLSILLNSDVYDSAPGLVETLQEAGCELIAHGRSNSDSLAGRSLEDERTYLASVRERIEKRGAVTPLGWSSPWLTHTENTIDLLAECGYGYVLDFGMDERPLWLTRRDGRLLHIPYALELNDSATIIGRQASANEFRQMIVDQFDELLHASREQPLVMSVVVHSFISGQPFRMRQLTQALEHILSHHEEIWLTTPDRIYRSVLDNPALAV